MMTPEGQPPQHVAFIMDGNGRWAKRKGMSRLKGHHEGAETVRRVCAACMKRGIKYVTFYAFSSENWQRPWEEVSGLFDLMRAFFKKELAVLVEKGIKVQFIGDRTEGGRLDADILTLMKEVEAATCHNTRLTMTLALNYGAREEIVRATRLLVGQGVDVTVDNLAAALDTGRMPDPDLVIRTGGEQRLSNFLLWQAAYAELYFSPVAWPDFDDEAFDEALKNYAGRQRRFGGLMGEDAKPLPL